MADPLALRAITAEEEQALRELAHSRTAEARLRDRARICWLSHQGQRVAGIKTELRIADGTVRLWITRFNADGLDGLRDRRRGGRPATYTAEQVGELVATSLTAPPGTRGAVRELDPGPAGGVPQRGTGHRHQAQPDRGDPAGRGAALAAAGDVVR